MFGAHMWIYGQDCLFLISLALHHISFFVHRIFSFHIAYSHNKSLSYNLFTFTRISSWLNTSMFRVKQALIFHHLSHFGFCWIWSRILGVLVFVIKIPCPFHSSTISLLTLSSTSRLLSNPWSLYGPSNIFVRSLYTNIWWPNSYSGDLVQFPAPRPWQLFSQPL